MKLINYTHSVSSDCRTLRKCLFFIPTFQPATVKENAIIEKTAKFIAEHGVQMEIVMKTKQANNQTFDFMYFENILHPFYKHLVKMIKCKKYIPKSPQKEVKEQHNESKQVLGFLFHNVQKLKTSSISASWILETSTTF